MSANLSVDGKIWTRCRWCGNVIWRYCNGNKWRTSRMDSECVPSPIDRHFAER